MAEPGAEGASTEAGNGASDGPVVDPIADTGAADNSDLIQSTFEVHVRRSDTNWRAMAAANVVAAGHARRPTRQPGFTAAQRQDV